MKRWLEERIHHNNHSSLLSVSFLSAAERRAVGERDDREGLMERGMIERDDREGLMERGMIERD